MEPAVLLSIGVGLVPRVHDGTLERGLEADLLLEEVGAGRQLEGDVDTARGAGFGAHLAGAAVDLTGDEVRHDVLHDSPEGHRAVHEVVLMGAVRVALAVGVVLVDDDVLTGRQRATGRHHGLGEDALAGLVVEDDLAGVGALGRGVLGMGVVDVVPGPVGEHGIDEVGLDVRRHSAVAGVATGVVSW